MALYEMCRQDKKGMLKEVTIIYFEVLILTFGGGREGTHEQPSVVSATWKKLESWHSRLVTAHYGHNISALGLQKGVTKGAQEGRVQW